MASLGEAAEGGTNEEFSDIIKWRSGKCVFSFLIVFFFSSHKQGETSVATTCHSKVLGKGIRHLAAAFLAARWWERSLKGKSDRARNALVHG